MGASQVVLVIKNPPVNAGEVRDSSWIPGLRRCPEGGRGNPLQYSSLENPHEERSLAGYNPQPLKESDMTEPTEHIRTEAHCLGSNPASSNYM